MERLRWTLCVVSLALMNSIGPHWGIDSNAIHLNKDATKGEIAAVVFTGYLWKNRISKENCKRARMEDNNKNTEDR